jgi:hypothetical protein
MREFVVLEVLDETGGVGGRVIRVETAGTEMDGAGTDVLGRG